MPLFFFLRRKGDSNPRYPYEYDSLANCWFQPLTHLSFRADAQIIRLYLKYASLDKQLQKYNKKMKLPKIISFFCIFYQN